MLSIKRIVICLLACILAMAAAFDNNIYQVLCAIINSGLSWLWYIINYPLLAVNMIGYIMLLISPLTRALAMDFVNLLFAVVTSYLRRFTDPKHAMQEKINALIAEHEKAMKTLMKQIGDLDLALSRATTDLKTAQEEVVTLRNLKHDVQNKLDVANIRLHELQADANVQQAAETRSHLEEKNRIIAERDSEINRLHSARLHKQDALDASRGAKKALAKNEARLLHEVSTLQQQLRHKTAQSDLRYKATQLNEAIVLAIHGMAETPGIPMLAAVCLAQTLQANGVALGELGIDVNRYQSLVEFVALGQDAASAVKPRGFRLEGLYFPLSRSQVVGTTVTQAYALQPHMALQPLVLPDPPLEAPVKDVAQLCQSVVAMTPATALIAAPAPNDEKTSTADAVAAPRKKRSHEELNGLSSTDKDASPPKKRCDRVVDELDEPAADHSTAQAIGQALRKAGGPIRIDRSSVPKAARWSPY